MKLPEAFECLRQPPCGIDGLAHEWRTGNNWSIVNPNIAACPRCQHEYVDWLTYWCKEVYLRYERIPLGNLRISKR